MNDAHDSLLRTALPEHLCVCAFAVCYVCLRSRCVFFFFVCVGVCVCVCLYIYMYILCGWVGGWVGGCIHKYKFEDI
jgi:hypothetical protein